MSKTLAFLIVAVTVTLALPAFAELQNVTVGGQIHIRGNWWTSPASINSFTARNPLFQPPWTSSFEGVPGGNPLASLRWPAQPGRLAVVSPVPWNDDQANDMRFVEQRTRLNVRADFTENVSAFIEFDQYNNWGEDFRSDYVTGQDFRSGLNKIELYQGYIEANEMFGQPLRLRIGRQEMIFGSGWLVGNNDAFDFFFGLSFDGIRATYATDLFSVDAFWAKLVERSPIEEDGDVDFYGVYGSYKGIENISLDAYWFFVRDARRVADTNLGFFGEWVEDVFDVDDYDVTNLHTVGLRGAGKYAAFDFEAEVAYQFGNADAVGSRVAGSGLLSPYGDDTADFGNWGANLKVGYAFDVMCRPHLFTGGAYFGGDDNRSLDFWDWLGATFNPFWKPDSSVSFNRLFTNWQYGDFVSALNKDCTNLWVVYGGIDITPTDALTLIASVAYVQSIGDYSAPWPVFYPFGLRVAPLAFFSFLDEENKSDLCWEAAFKAIYRYSEDLTFEAGYSHIFLGDGAAAGNFNIGYGLAFEGGTDNDDADYFYFDTKLKF